MKMLWEENRTEALFSRGDTYKSKRKYFYDKYKEEEEEKEEGKRELIYWAFTTHWAQFKC